MREGGEIFLFLAKVGQSYSKLTPYFIPLPFHSPAIDF